MRHKIFFGCLALFLCCASLSFGQQGQADSDSFPEGAQQELSEAEPAAAYNTDDVSQTIGSVLVQESKAGPDAKSENISLDAKGMDVVDVLKMLSARSGLNMVIGKNVTGRVTLFLKDVNASDAFEIVLAANDLAYEKKGIIINVMTQRDYELLHGQRHQDKKEVKVIQLKYAKAVDLANALNQMKSNIGKVIVNEGSNTLVLVDTPEKLQEMEEFIDTTDLPVETRIFNLSYAKADKMSSKLEEVITKGVGAVRIDERTNKIFVTDYVDKFEKIAGIVKAFDEKEPQVLIDAQIIQLTPSDLFEMGVNWDYWIKKYFDMKANLPIGNDNRLFIGTPDVDPTKPGDYKAIIDVLRTIGDTKVLSSPRIMVINNQEAKIHVGTRDAYITSSVSQSGTGTAITSQSVNFVDTGIQLFVIPTISRDGFVTMKLKPEISDSTRTDITSEGQITQVPIVTTSEAETTVMVKDGVTLIIGGLTKEKRDKTVKKIPLFGDIPFLGHLFRSVSDDVTKIDLVILLTPHIVTGESSFTDFQEIKPKDGIVASMVNGEIVKERVVETPRSISRQYNKYVIDRIRSVVMLDRPQRENGNVRTSFVLGSQGQLIGEPQIISSTNNGLDAFTISTIESAAPFSSFPEALKEEVKAFEVVLKYRKKKVIVE